MKVQIVVLYFHNSPSNSWGFILGSDLGIRSPVLIKQCGNYLLKVAYLQKLQVVFRSLIVSNAMLS